VEKKVKPQPLGVLGVLAVGILDRKDAGHAEKHFLD
jgi:hypothetical protein